MYLARKMIFSDNETVEDYVEILIDRGRAEELFPFLNRRLTPEETLLVAVLFRALADIHPSWGANGLTQSEVRMANNYFTSPVIRYGTFRHFCCIFNLEYEDGMKAIFNKKDYKLLEDKLSE